MSSITIRVYKCAYNFLRFYNSNAQGIVKFLSKVKEIKLKISNFPPKAWPLYIYYTNLPNQPVYRHGPAFCISKANRV